MIDWGETDSFQYPLFGMVLENAGVTRVGQYNLGQNIAEKLSKLKVQSCKLYNNKYIIASIQITNTKTFALIAVKVFELLSRKVLFINRKDKMANFTGKLLENYKKLEFKILSILLKHVSNHLSVPFQFAWLYL